MQVDVNEQLATYESVPPVGWTRIRTPPDSRTSLFGDGEALSSQHKETQNDPFIAGSACVFTSTSPWSLSEKGEPCYFVHTGSSRDAIHLCAWATSLVAPSALQHIDGTAPDSFVEMQQWSWRSGGSGRANTPCSTTKHRVWHRSTCVLLKPKTSP